MSQARAQRGMPDAGRTGFQGRAAQRALTSAGRQAAPIAPPARSTASSAESLPLMEKAQRYVHAFQYLR